MLKNLVRFRKVNALLRHTKPLLQTLTCPRRLATRKTNIFAESLPAKQTAAQTEDELPTTTTTTTKKQHSNPFASESTLEEDLPDYARAAPQHLSAEERERRLKVLQLEVDISNQEGRRVPTLAYFQQHHWDQVLALPSKSARSKYYSYLWQVEMKKESKERKREERTESGILRKEEVLRERAENEHIIYGLAHTNMLLRIYDSTINHWQNNRLTRAMQFSPKIVLDCSYDRHMNKREAINAAKQLMLCFAQNRSHDEPFDLHYCNVNLRSQCMQSLQRYIPTMLQPEFPMNVHEQCFTEIFPKESLIYLTPHCRTDLVQYDPDAVYIVGAMVDTVHNEPLSLAKAKKLGIRMARLPLDRYLQWGAGSGKSLTLNQMVNIMLDLKHSGDWMQALSHVPRRKLANAEGEQWQQKNAMTKRATKLNVRIDRVFSDDDASDETNNQDAPAPHKVRVHSDDLQFNLETWGSKKKNRNSR